MPYTQENRLIAIDTPLGDDVLLLQGFTGHEGISRLFTFHLDLLSENNSISFDDIVGQNVTINVTLADQSQRYFNGYVSRFAQSGSDARFTHYQMEVVPWLWFLTRNADCRIFQNMSIPDIIQKVFSDRGFSDFKSTLTGTYDPREYCVQYRETDFNFVSRLMEHVGIFYFFEHEDGKHTLVLADSTSAYQPCPGQSTAQYNQAGGGLDAEDVVTGWNMEQELRTGKYSVTDYNFETPSTSLLSSEPTVIEVGGNTSYEIYDYPGDHLNQSDGGGVAKLRMQEEEAAHKVINGSSTCRSFTSGYQFDLEDHYRDDMNDSYVLTEIQHVATEGGSYNMTGGGGGESYSNHFTSIPADVPFRPARITPKPFVQGPQTALVVGKAGEEIWVDNYGRVIVQFYWDRNGQQNENSSCWIRTSQPWGGGNWGAMWIPRIGQEVIVSFLEGDPDRPIITGRVYNAEQMPPYDLPDHQTVSTFMSRSSKGGGAANFNEIRFEDKQGNEQLFINAERDMDHRVEVDSREFVGSNRHLSVGANQTESVGANKHLQVAKNQREQIGSDMSLTIGANLFESVGADEHVTIGNNRQESVGANAHLNVGATRIENIGTDMHLNVGANRVEQVGNNMNLTVGASSKESIAANMNLTVGSNRSEAIGSNHSLTVGQDSNEQIGQNHAMQAGMNIYLAGGMNVVIEAGMQLTLSGPGGFITIGPAGVAIQGTMVLINSGGAAGSGSGPSPSSPDSPDSPKSPDAPKTPKNADSPQVADDGSAFQELG
jgi:type VI secretion system secreted protein VgrG